MTTKQKQRTLFVAISILIVFGVGSSVFWMVRAQGSTGGDLTQDGCVNSADLQLALSAFNKTALGDVTGDGNTTLHDLAIIGAHFTNNCTSSGTPIVIGLEYAFPGTETSFGQTGISGIKFYPATYTKWDQMQPAADQPISFAKLDDMVQRYQSHGMTNITIGLRYDGTWSSIDGGPLIGRTNGLPKPEYMDDYDIWLTSIVERYDHDGINDMPGLSAPISLYEIGVEFSSYAPEPTTDYITFLARSYQVAHAAYPSVRIAHAAFLATNAFKDNPTSAQYPAAFANIPDQTKTLADMRAVLDHPEAFDVLNIHAIGDPTEIDGLFTWLRYETQQRGYTKPVIVSDTSPNPFIAFGQATDCAQFVKGAMIYPATEADRCRIATYFTNLIGGDAAALAFVRAFVAEDTAKKIVIAAGNGAQLIDASFTEDFELLKAPASAGAGNAAWGGVVDVDRNALTQLRTVRSTYPNWYALKQVTTHLANYNALERVATADPTIRLYKITKNSGFEWVVWYEPGTVYLPGEAVPSKTVALPGLTGTMHSEVLITAQNQTTPTTSTINPQSIVLTPTPLFLTP